MAEQGMAGFGPEINYFRDPTPEEIEAGKPPAIGGEFNFQTNPQLQQAVNDLIAGRITLEEYQQMVSGLTSPGSDPAPQSGRKMPVGGRRSLRGYSEYAEGGKAESFDKAFAEARRKGEDTFIFDGDVFSTKTAEENLQERRSRERLEDRLGPLYKRFRDNLTDEQKILRKRQKEYDDFILNELLEGRKDFLSRGAQMRVDALAKERQGMQEGGEVMSEGEIDLERLILLAEAAIRGELPEEEAEVVIKMFIDEFGEEAFMQLRESVLEAIVPNSQKEGEIVGQGGGMDDLVQGMIGTQQPVAVSPGEYIVPADVVSGLGDGSTDAGVRELDGMLDRVRMERTGTTQQPAPLAKGGILPR